jgi:hypothetical protein
LHLLDEVAQQAGAVIFPGFQNGRNPGRKRGFKVILLGTLTVCYRVGSALELFGRAINLTSAPVTVNATSNDPHAIAASVATALRSRDRQLIEQLKSARAYEARLGYV